jgi:hypothetical protein
MEGATTNDELRLIFEQDQADRQGELHPEAGQRDRARRARVEKLIAADALQAPEDYFHAAMVSSMASAWSTSGERTSWR